LAIALVTAALLTLILSVDLLPRIYEVREGDVAAVPIKAPGPISYVSQVRTRAARDEAAAQVQPIYDLDRDLIAQQTRGLADLIQAISAARGDPARRPAPDQLATVIGTLAVPPLSDTTARHLAEVDEYRWSTIASESQKLLPDILKDRIPDERVSEVRQDVALRANPLLAPADRGVIVELVQSFVRANLVLNR
jgi:membrane-associated HD superfamily phosphohydrolase